MCGDIAVASEVGKGSVFTVNIQANVERREMQMEPQMNADARR